MYNADVIVFEHLDTQGKKKGRGKQKLALWRKQEIQKLVEHKAHILGIRISHICAWNTSKLAFDGSGKVERGTYVQNGVEKYYHIITCLVLLLSMNFSYSYISITSRQTILFGFSQIVY